MKVCRGSGLVCVGVMICVRQCTSFIHTDVGVCIGNGSVALNPHPGTSPRLRSCYEAFSILAMTVPLLTLLENKGLYESFSSVEMPHLSCLSKMETDGFGEYSIMYAMYEVCLLYAML